MENQWLLLLYSELHYKWLAVAAVHCKVIISYIAAEVCDLYAVVRHCARGINAESICVARFYICVVCQCFVHIPVFPAAEKGETEILDKCTKELIEIC